MKHAIITICLILLVPAVCACGRDLLVPSQYPTIRAAVDAAIDGDTVIIAPGTYTGDGNHNITVLRSVTIRSQDGPETCLIDCNDPNIGYTEGFMMRAGTLTGLTIRSSSSPGDSRYRGTIIFDHGSAKLSNCVLKGNVGLPGRAIFCSYSNAEITNCTIMNNTTDLEYRASGGGIYCENSSLMIANSTISGNSATNGGGIYCSNNSNVTIKNCVITGNGAMLPYLPGGGGGGIYCEQSSLIVLSSKINCNISINGGGINCFNANSLLISDCNISNNVVTNVITSGGGNYSSGGGIYFYYSKTPSGATFAILNSSIKDNEVNGIGPCKGGGIYIEAPVYSNPQSVFIIDGCKIIGNSAGPLSSTQGYSNGGGLYCNGQVILFETEIRDNSAYQGGGIYSGPQGLNSSGLKLNRCILKGNRSTNGNAVLSYADDSVFENCLISGNRNLRINSPTISCPIFLKMTNCTVVGNSYPVIGAGAGYVPKSSISNSIIYNNQTISPNIISLGLDVTYSDVQRGNSPKEPPYPGIGNINADPCFVVPGHWDTNGTPDTIDDVWVEGDYRLTAGSPCVDLGGVAFLMDNKDLAGNPRIIAAGIDMGAYENNNTPPIADAGPDRNVFAWINGKATITLDGSKSLDSEGDSLSYLWQWTVDCNIVYETNGVSPTIELPVGQHTIGLIVNDGFEDSQPDDVNITVTGPVQGRLWVFPCMINRHGLQKSILTMVKLPAGITKEQVDNGFKLLLYPGAIEAKTQRTFQYWDDGVFKTALSASFDAASILSAINMNGNVTLDVVGKLTSGQYFFSQASVRIFDNPKQW